MSKVAIVRIINDVYRPDYCGGEALDYCMKHGLSHLAFRKGELLVMSVEKYDSFWTKQTGGNFPSAFGCKFHASTDAVTLDRLKNWVKRHNFEEDVSLADAIDECSHFGGSTPTTDELIFVRIIDGDVPLKDFHITE